MLLTTQSAITDEQIKKLDFYHDFITYLNRVKQKPVNRTSTGNISLTDIKELLNKLKTTRKIINEHQEHNWSIRSEDHLQPLTQIKIIAAVLHLTQNRKGRIHLTRKGANFLNSLSPLQQYEQIVLTYWQKVNWDYFSYSTGMNNLTLNSTLQDIQEHIWQALLQKGPVWIDYIKFCHALSEYFHLHNFFDHKYHHNDPYFVYTDIELDLFKKNLLLFNCIEIEETKGQSIWNRYILRFRPTPLGIHIFTRATPAQQPDFTT